MKKKVLSLMLVFALCIGMMPPMTETAEAADSTKVGESSIDNGTFKALGIDTDAEDLIEQAGDELTPYGRGYASLLTRNELFYTNHWGNGDSYNISNSGNKSFSKSGTSAHDFADGDAFRSVAFDPMGDGKANYIATVSAEVNDNGDTNITLSIDTTEKNSDKKDIAGITAELSTLPFEVSAENAGAWLGIAAGNFDGDEYNTQEIAVYRPYAGEKTYGDTYVYGSTIEIFSVQKDMKYTTKIIIPSMSVGPVQGGDEEPTPKEVRKEITGTFKTISLVSQAVYDLKDRTSDYYFYDNYNLFTSRTLNEDWKARDWKYQYRFPALSLETVKQPENSADDLCVTFTAPLGGAIAKKNSAGDINAKRPYDCATGVFFWIDPLTENQKNTGVTQMRFNWKSNYSVYESVDKKGKDKYEVMVFGDGGAGDINGDGYQEVVVAGYLMDKQDQVMDGTEQGDWKISTNEYAATFFTYDEGANTYKKANQAMNWISLKKSDYENATALGEGIFSNYGGKDMVHNPLPVTCFAEKGSGYGESVAMGGIICEFDQDSDTSERIPDTNLKSYSFHEGVFNPRYAIPTELIHGSFNHGVQNRLFTETVAGNFDGNALGQEQLAFVYVGKVKEESKWSSAYGIISQNKVGEPDHVYNVNDKKKNYLGDDIRFKYWTAVTKDRNFAPASVCAADTDSDSTILRYSGKPNEYFFSDPNIVAVLQAAPYFKSLDYSDTGATTIELTEGTSSESEHGLSIGLQVQVGFEVSGILDGFSTRVGVSSEFNRTWGKGTTQSYSLAYSAGAENSVALVMTPYVRYHYETYNPKTKEWSPMVVDSPQTPRASIITVSKYDEVAEQMKSKGWEKIGNNVLKNTAGYPSTYDSSTANKTEFYGGKAVGANTKSDFVKVGSGDSAGAMAQTISAEKTTFVNMSWSVKEVADVEVKSGSVTYSVSQSAGYTGASGKSDFSGYDYVGEVTNIPEGNEDFSFAWRFGAWKDTLKINKKEMQFPVLGYLVKDVMQKPIYPENIHVADAGSNFLTLAWQRPLEIGDGDKNAAFTLYRFQHGVYYPLATIKNTDIKDGLFTFMDKNVKSFKEYDYALRTANLIGNRYIYSEYSPLLQAYTISGDYNIPKIELIWDGKSYGGKFRIQSGSSGKLTAAVTPAEGADVGGFILQWQRYEPDNGGWIDISGNQATTGQITVQASAADYLYRCRVSQRINDEIVTVYSGSVEPEVWVKSAAPTKYTVKVDVVGSGSVLYEIGESKDKTAGGSYVFSPGTEVQIEIERGSFSSEESDIKCTLNSGTCTFTMPSKNVTITINGEED